MQVLDNSNRVMKKRLLVRRNKDISHIYCLVAKGTRDEIVKIGIDTASPSDPLRIMTIFASRNSRLLVLEPDPDNRKHLFVLDEEQRIILLEDKASSFSEATENDSKAELLSTVDMSKHQLEDEIISLEQIPFASAIITSRMLIILNKTMS